MQLAIDLVGILLMIAIAQLLARSKASGGGAVRRAACTASDRDLPGGREESQRGSKPHVTRLFCFLTLRRLIKDGALEDCCAARFPSLPSAPARGPIARWFNDVCVMSAHPSKAAEYRTSVDVSEAP